MTCFVKSTSGFGSGHYLFPNYIHDLPNGVTHSTVGFAREVDPKWIHPCIDSMARCSVLKNHKIHGTYHHFRSEME